MEKVRSSQASISINSSTELIKTQFFFVSIVDCNTVVNPGGRVTSHPLKASYLIFVARVRNIYLFS